MPRLHVLNLLHCGDMASNACVRACVRACKCVCSLGPTGPKSSEIVAYNECSAACCEVQVQLPAEDIVTQLGF